MLKSNGFRIEPWGTHAQTFSTDWKSYLFCNVGICLPKNWFLVRSVIIIDNNEHSKKKFVSCFRISTKN